MAAKGTKYLEMAGKGLKWLMMRVENQMGWLYDRFNYCLLEVSTNILVLGGEVRIDDIIQKTSALSKKLYVYKPV